MVKKKAVDSDYEDLKADIMEIKRIVYNMDHNSSCKRVKHHYKWFHDPWYWFGWAVIVIMLLFTVCR